MTGENGFEWHELQAFSYRMVTDRVTMQDVSLKDMMDEGEWTPVTLPADEENTLVWKESDPRAQTWQAVAAEVANPNLYEKWLLSAVKDNYVFTYRVPAEGETITAYRPLGQYMKDASAWSEAEIHESFGEPLWIKGVTWYFDEWFDTTSACRAGKRIGLHAQDAYRHLHGVFDIVHDEAMNREREEHRATIQKPA